MSRMDSDKYTLQSIFIILLIALSVLNFATPALSRSAEEINPVNGIIHSKIDGIIAQASSENFASEWEDARSRSIELQSIDTNISAVLRKKIVEDVIYIASELPSEISLDALQYLAVTIDGDNDKALSFGKTTKVETYYFF